MLGLHGFCSSELDFLPQRNAHGRRFSDSFFSGGQLYPPAPRSFPQWLKGPGWILHRFNFPGVSRRGALRFLTLTATTVAAKIYHLPPFLLEGGSGPFVIIRARGHGFIENLVTTPIFLPTS